MSMMRKKTPPPMPAWHPDFRDVTTLPDVKAVRTSFFINGVTILVLLVAALYLVFQEYGRKSLQLEIEALETRIENNRERNAEALDLNSKFKTEERYINEVVDYLDDSLAVSELLVALSETLHPGMSLSLIRYQNITERGSDVGKELLLNGVIDATPDAAASAITEYLKVFDEDPFFAGIVGEATPTSLVPAATGNRMSFGIRLTLNDGSEETDS